MTHQQFKNWLEQLKGIWETKNPNAVVDLCAEEFLWFETPFNKPFTTKEGLLEEWKSILDQENISVSYEILGINENVGIAQWKATFVRLPSKEEITLDGIFKVSLDEQGKCIEFHQWYNAK